MISPVVSSAGGSPRSPALLVHHLAVVTYFRGADAGKGSICPSVQKGNVITFFFVFFSIRGIFAWPRWLALPTARCQPTARPLPCSRSGGCTHGAWAVQGASRTAWSSLWMCFASLQAGPPQRLAASRAPSGASELAAQGTRPVRNMPVLQARSLPWASPLCVIRRHKHATYQLPRATSPRVRHHHLQLHTALACGLDGRDIAVG